MIDIEALNYRSDIHPPGFGSFTKGLIMQLIDQISRNVSLTTPHPKREGVLEQEQAFSDSRPWHRFSPALATTFRISPGSFQTLTGDPL